MSKEKFRLEEDSFGKIAVPLTSYYGAQTERALKNFQIGKKVFPLEFIRALTIVKKSAFFANLKLGELKLTKKEITAVNRTCDEIILGKLQNEFPLSIWQSGSGTQTNMNMNEVISNRANEILGSTLGSKKPIHPNDHINRGQSTNDVFPTAMQIVTVQETLGKLMPTLKMLIKLLQEKSKKWQKIIKLGRTHLNDATPISIGQEFSGYEKQITDSLNDISRNLNELYELPIGGTAVGTGLNARKGFDDQVIKNINQETGLKFKKAKNKYALISAHDNFVALSGSFRRLAVALNKIANDIRLLGSGPNGGIGEYLLPENEPGSSIMPGKVNPTQCEALAMICIRVFGNDASIAFAGSQGHLQLNTYKPLIAYYILESIAILTDGINSFSKNCLKDLSLNIRNIEKNLGNSLMLVTSLNKHIGYEKGAKIANLAYKENISLKEACLRLKILNAVQFDKIVDPKKMITPHK